MSTISESNTMMASTAMVFRKLTRTIRNTIYGSSGNHYAPIPNHDRTESFDSNMSDPKDSEMSSIESNHTSCDVASKNRWISPRTISDATIGLSDGLTVPFALTAGLSALGENKFVIYGGMAELIAGAISMGVGGYLGARGEW